jgi:hypothetical protein
MSSSKTLCHVDRKVWSFAIGMTGNPLGDLQRSSILQKLVFPVALRKWGENASDSSASLSRRLGILAASIRVAERFPSFRVLPSAIGKGGAFGRFVRPDISKYRGQEAPPVCGARGFPSPCRLSLGTGSAIAFQPRYVQCDTSRLGCSGEWASHKPCRPPESHISGCSPS